MRRLRIWIFAVAAGALSVLPAAPAGAVGAGSVHFEVNGDLQQFPCEINCLPTQFTGTGDGSGRVTKTIDGDTHDATFTILNGKVSGTATYDEPGEPACPLFGNAAGSVTLEEGAGSTTGIIRRTSTPTLAGTVADATTTINFFYQRVGFNAVVQILGGKVTLEYTYGGVPGTLTQNISMGAAHALFIVNAQQAREQCTNPGSIRYDLIGDAAVVGPAD